MREPAKRAAPRDRPREAHTWLGRDLTDRLGHRVGRIEALFPGEARAPDWVAVRTGLRSTRQSLVPITQARSTGARVRVPFDKQHIMRGPRFFEPDEVVLRREQARLCRHYGVEESPTHPVESSPDPGARTQLRPSATGKDVATARPESITRSEEELGVGTVWRERARLRVRKYVVTEQVQVTVPIRREEIRIDNERPAGERADGARPGGEPSTDALEIILHEEVPVVEKRVVPRERVRVTKETRTEDVEITEDLRKERIEVESGLDD